MKFVEEKKQLDQREQNKYEYTQLKSIYSCLVEIQKKQLLIDKEEKRLEKIHALIALKKSQQQELAEEIKILDHLFEKIDQQLRQRLSEDKKNQLETEALTSLEQKEEKQIALNDTETFLAGVKRTEQEIQEEIATNNKPLLAHIAQLSMEKEVLLKNLSIIFLAAFEKAYFKHPTAPFSRLEGLNCSVCRASVSANVRSQLDTQFEPQACLQCQRLFLPYDC
jgi:hypothetical protein